MMKTKILYILLCSVLLIGILGACTATTEPQSSVLDSTDEILSDKVIDDDNDTGKSRKEDREDGYTDCGDLLVRYVEDDSAYEFSLDDGETWRSDWDNGLPEGYTYEMIDEKTITIDYSESDGSISSRTIVQDGD